MKSSESSAIVATPGGSQQSDSASPGAGEAALMSQPTYAAAFQCIGPSCEDPCCGDWDIPLDKKTYEKYQEFSSEKLGAIVSQFVIVNRPHQPDELYGVIRRTSSGLCPFFGVDRLCGIQKDYGNQLLSATCSIYPRSLSVVADRLEGALSLSCPEAARNVLLIPDFMHRVSDLYSGDFRTDNFYGLAVGPDGSDEKPRSIFLPLRKIMIDLVRDRSRPLWNRLLMIGRLCERLDLIEGKQGVAALQSSIRSLGQPLNIPLLQAEIDDLPSNPRLRLKVIFELTDILIRDGSSDRFQDTFWSFIAGIGSPSGSLLVDDVECFLQAERNYHLPFFEANPFILENYLVNYMFQNLFPYGRSGSADFVPQSIFAEYLQMATQFAWINALLIGIAGHHKEAFAAEHVVKAIQSFTRAVEHYPDVLKSVNRHMSSRDLNSLHGMAIMLKR
jgi:lysine-N-methylase